VEKARIRFLPDDLTIEAPIGAMLLDMALEAGIFVPASCGGAGSCARCKVRVIEGAVEPLTVEKLRPKDRAEGYVLACQARITGNAVIEVPTTKAVRKVIPRDEAERMRVTATPMESPLVPTHNPMAFGIPVNLRPPVALDNTCDFERLLRTLKVDHDVPSVTADLSLLRELPTVVREDPWKVTACLRFEDIPGCEATIHHLFRVIPGHSVGPLCAMAVDIGTTSLWGELIDLDTGEILARASRYNPQISMGDDVISRIVFSLKRDGLAKLQQHVAAGINEITDEVLKRTGRSADSVAYMVAAGNTVMTHLFLGLYPKFLREWPYVPVAQHVDPIPARDLGLNLPSQSFVRVFPGVASYVGGDIVSGVLANGMWDSDEMTLFIDIGTNGEIVAGNRDLLMTAACSAGPAFEGGGLEHGMRAAPGAIEGVLIDPETFEPMIKTIDSKLALGICGSGIINLISQLLRLGLMDRNAKFAHSLDTPRIRQGRSGYEYVVVWAAETGINEDIVLTEADLDNILRAKAAMFSGYTCLLDKIGLGVDALDRVIIAGAFGSFINLEHAITVGLLPDIPRDKFAFIGNSSLKGARLSAVDRSFFEKGREIARSMTNVELSEDPAYMDNFMAALFLPHTREELFPSVRLGG
jgi:uncharacterized 2Fe-2S/4Fe-4S cluster protein (DUF4445 family)